MIKVCENKTLTETLSSEEMNNVFTALFNTELLTYTPVERKGEGLQASQAALSKSSVQSSEVTR